MIIVRRCPANVNLNQLQRNIRSMSFTATSSPSQVRVSGTGTTMGSGSDQNQTPPFDWAAVLSPENKANTIQLLTFDRENAGFTFPEEDPTFRKAAVLIPLCYDVEGRPSLLYNLRSSTLNKHKGEISFPGGGMDPEDKNDPVVAALRETHEELGITRDSIEVWTTVRVFPTVSTHMGVIPVLGFIKGGPLDPKALNINPDEVDHAFTITLEHLCNPTNWDENKASHKFRGRDFVMPMWKNLKVFNGSQEEIHLWGLTAFVTHIALSALLPAGVYRRNIPYSPLTLKKKKAEGTEKSTSSSGGGGTVARPNSSL